MIAKDVMAKIRAAEERMREERRRPSVIAFPREPGTTIRAELVGPETEIDLTITCYPRFKPEIRYDLRWAPRHSLESREIAYGKVNMRLPRTVQYQLIKAFMDQPIGTAFIGHVNDVGPRFDWERHSRNA